MISWPLFWSLFSGAALVSTLLGLRLLVCAWRSRLWRRAPGHSLFNLLVLLIWLQMALEASPWHNRFSDYAGPVGLAMLLPAAPLALLISRFSADGRSPQLALYRRGSRWLWAVQLFPGLLVIWFWLAWAAGR